MRKLHSLLVVLMSSLAACEGPTEPTVNFRIEGTVTNAATGAPIEGARVELAIGFTTLAATMTNSQGRYTISHRREHCWGSDSLIATAEGYKHYFETPDARFEKLPCTSEPLTVNLRLTPR